MEVTCYCLCIQYILEQVHCTYIFAGDFAQSHGLDLNWYINKFKSELADNISLMFSNMFKHTAKLSLAKQFCSFPFSWGKEWNLLGCP